MRMRGVQQNIFLSVITIVLFLLTIISFAPSVFATEAAQEVFFSSLQTTGGTGKAGEEFFELFNPNTEEIDLTGWRVRYTNGTGGNNKTLASFDEFLLSQTHILFVSTSYKTSHESELASIDHKLFLYNGGLADTGGYIYLEKPTVSEPTTYELVDRLGWGNASLDDELLAEKPSNGNSLKRCVDEQQLYVNRNDDSIDFVLISEPLHLQVGPYCDGMDPNDEESEEPGISCEGLIINEIVPNPAGSDSGKEFVELYNPTAEVISLAGCTLQTSANTKVYAFEDIALQPNSYIAFYDSDTGLTLTNASGGSVWLISAKNVEIQAITYPADLGDDISWSLFDGEWATTYAVTVAKKNILQEELPCPAGQERNPETNRCRNITSDENELKPCDEGQERNPATNRCRSVLGTSTTLKACSPGQVRNPETNRCRKVSSNNGFTPCKPGQERNPETNRCRKVATVSGSGPIPGVQDVKAGSTKETENSPKNSSQNWWIIGGVLATVLLYGLYEWRHDIENTIKKIKN